MKYSGHPQQGGRIDGVLTAREKGVLFLPLLLYLGYVYYLAFHSPRPFLLRWLDGSFGLFVALVFCNLIRRHLMEKDDPSEDPRSGKPPAAPEGG